MKGKRPTGSKRQAAQPRRTLSLGDLASTVPEVDIVTPIGSASCEAQDAGPRPPAPPTADLHPQTEATQDLTSHGAKAKPKQRPAVPQPVKGPATSEPETTPSPEPSHPMPLSRPATSQAYEDGGGTAGPTPGLADFERLSRNMGRLMEETQKVATAYLEPRVRSEPKGPGEDAKDMIKTLGQVASYWFMDPTRMVVAQASLSSQLIDLWADTMRRMSGGPTSAPEPERPPDKRFSAPEWREFPAFDFLRQAYLRTSDWAKTMVEDAELDPDTREKARFYLRQVTGALSPSNFLATNPELLKHTFAEGGDNLVRGMQMLAEDIAAGKGELKIRQSDTSTHQLGVNMAMTPGKVVFRNDLMELIQYAPSTPEVYRRPLLIVPPWINKFYVLDLNPAKSFIGWCVGQGLTVFVISWVNPDERHADMGFEAYMRDGILAGIDAIEAATGERDVTTIGYCVGGTLLAVTLAYLAAKGDRRVSSTTFFTAQTDFRDAGDLKIFADEEQIDAIEAEMKETGYLRGAKMANAFNMLRPNELIWPYVVDNYIKGKAPMPFDLLTWNADSTRMPAANHAFYLRNCYLGNKLTQGEMTIGGETLDLGRVTLPVYNLATREDHIAPARSVFNGAKFFGGPMRYVLSGSGHIAGVVNPPSKAKYQYWSGPAVEGSFEDWVAAAVETAGSWWPDWIQWIIEQAPDKVPARRPGDGTLVPLCDAPGEYVRVKS